MKKIILIIPLIIFMNCFAEEQKVDFVLVLKSEQKMYLLSKGSVLKTYNVSLGSNPIGHKQQEGDNRTPEGKYLLDYKKINSSLSIGSINTLSNPGQTKES